jgi:Short C-terminal domain
MRMRRRRPLMRAAMVGGVAYHAGKKVQEGRDDDYERDARMDQMEAQQAQQAQQPQGGGGMTDNTIEQLGKLGQLHEQGVLTDAEFEVQKQKLLQGM